ncbi:MAG: DUF6056 family protein [Treponema sp.]|nr:DUF6056 family protein [Treponema sp.]MCL2273069.1 DUF6056 family protein [Treponema sp.]
MNFRRINILIQKYNRLLIAFCACIILLFFLLNVYTPLIADDYSYSSGINTVSDIFISQYHHYFYWGGRNVAHFFVQFWLLAGKAYFNIANTIVYCFFILLVQFHVYGTLKKNPFFFIIFNIIFWFSIPAWGQNILWLTGSCNYLWTTTIILFFLVPYRKKYDNVDFKMNKIFSVLFIIVGVFAGWCNENSGAAILFFLLSYFVFKIINKDKFSLFEVSGFLGFLIGYILLIAAPGNYVRLEIIRPMNSNPYDFSIPLVLINKFISITGMMFKYFQPFIFFLLGFFICMMIYKIRFNKNLLSDKILIFYAFAFLAGAYSMILSPYFPERSFLIIFIFAFIVMGNILKKLEFKLPDFVRKNIHIIAVIGFLLLSFSFIDSSRRVVGVYFRWYDRIEYILSEKEKNNLDIEVRPISATDKHVSLYGVVDLTNDENDWPNTFIASHYGINTIKSNNEPMESLFINMRKRIRQLFNPGKIIQKERIYN